MPRLRHRRRGRRVTWARLPLLLVEGRGAGDDLPRELGTDGGRDRGDRRDRCPCPEQLRKVAALVLHAWRRDPETVRVLVREISRSPVLQERIGQFQQAFDALEQLIVRGQERGEFDAELDPRFATYAVWGTLDEILTGWVLGRLPSEPDDVDRAEATVIPMLRRALGG